jgi:hypothetical protein
MSGKPLRIEALPSGSTKYCGFELNDPLFDVGITHHATGLGKLKVYSRADGIEYNVPIGDLMKPMSEWRIERR